MKRSAVLMLGSGFSFPFPLIASATLIILPEPEFAEF
jgi:hypothetical protein